MVKKQSKLSRKSKSKKSRSMKKSQRGGTSSACTLQYAKGGSPKYGGIGTSNLHNTNPQASLDLDNKFMGYGGPVPLGSSIVGGSRKNNKKRLSKSKSKRKSNRKYKGGSSCSSEGVGTSSPKSQTFKQYLTNIDNNLSSVTGGSQMNNLESNPMNNLESNPMNNLQSNSMNSLKSNNKQVGSGYTSDPSEFIGGQPVHKAYEDNSPPALIAGKLIFGSPDQPVCGIGAIAGGSRRRKSMKKSKKNKKSKTQRGGEFLSLSSSKPADFSSAFNGEPGYFKYPDDMSGRSFTGKQPVWGANEI
jgi:hypothetical protein